MTQKAKKLGEAATSSELGFNHPAQDNHMNGSKPNIAAASAPAPKPTPEQVADAMRELEEKVLDLVHMARISNDIAERMFNDPAGRDGDTLNYSIHYGERETFLFSLHDVERRAKHLAVSYLAAWDGRIEA